jgi:amino acid transporter
LLGELVSIGTLLAFAIVCAGVWVLRFTADGDLKNNFQLELKNKKGRALPFLSYL